MRPASNDLTKFIIFSVALALFTSTLTYFVHRKLDEHFNAKNDL